MKQILRVAVGVLLGYALMVLVSTLVQEVWLGGVGWYKSPPGDLIVTRIFTCIAAAVGAVIATVIARRGDLLAAVILSFLAAIEMTYLIVTGKVPGPVWYWVATGVSLIVAYLVGAGLFLRFTKSRPSQTAEA